MVENLSDAFEIKLVGKTVFLKSDTQVIQLNLTKPTSSSTSVKVGVEFLDGSTTIAGTYASGKVTWKMGGQSLTNKYVAFTPTTALGDATNAETAFEDTSSGGSSGSGTAGSTYTLTTSSDTGTSFTGTTGDDAYTGVLIGELGTGTTFSPGDNLSGGAGTDTLTVNVSGDNDANDSGDGYQSASFVTTGIEKILVSNFDTDGNGGVNDLDMSGVDTGVTTVGLRRSRKFGQSDKLKLTD